MKATSCYIAVLMMLAAQFWGCGTANESAVSVNSAGKHPANWVSAHGALFLQDGTSCQSCHGATLGGGISAVSCSSASFNGLTCHTNGPHPVPWPDHRKAINQLNSCSPCHGVGLTGGATAPACAGCHLRLTPGTVPVPGTCTSCHAGPAYGPNGSVYPNISAAHKAHTLLPLDCSACHSGGGSGTVTHGKTLTLAFSAAYNGKGGAAVMNPDGSCANVSCHGGIRTRSWRGGRINPLQDCLQCHQSGSAAGTPQSNSYYSGKHLKHLTEIGLLCSDCHDMSVVSGGASHFSGLATPAFELPPAATLKAPLKFTAATRSCSPGSSPPAGSFSIGVCHSTKSW